MKALIHQRASHHRKKTLGSISVQIPASDFKSQIATLSHRHGGGGGVWQLHGCA
jgi:hypothetical protein